jgi:DNA-binding NarL/FixJ family response regulator
MTKIRVVLADDHPVVLAGMKALIQASPDIEVAGESSNGHSALQILQAEAPDIAIIDISMPEMGGIALAGRIMQSHAATKVLVLTAQEDRAYVQQLLSAGARGYVLKRSAADELIRAIRTVHAGGVYIDPAIADKMLAPREPGQAVPAGIALSDREEEVLKLAAQGWTNRESAEKLGISVKTVETYKARAAEKLALRTRAEIVRYGKTRGWLDEA